jgi:hypothetical protein
VRILVSSLGLVSVSVRWCTQISTAATLVRIGFVVVSVLVNVSGFAPFWHAAGTGPDGAGSAGSSSAPSLDVITAAHGLFFVLRRPAVGHRQSHAFA